MRRLAVERRAAVPVNVNNKSTTGPGAGMAGDDGIRPNGHMYEHDYADTSAGAAFESSGRTLEEEQRALREHSNEVYTSKGREWDILFLIPSFLAAYQGCRYVHHVHLVYSRVERRPNGPRSPLFFLRLLVYQ